MRWPFMLRRTHERIYDWAWKRAQQLEADNRQLREDYTNAFALARMWREVAQRLKGEKPGDGDEAVGISNLSDHE